MRNKMLSLLTILLMVVASCNTTPEASGRNGVQFKTPASYNDYIISRQLEVVGLIDQFASASGVL